MPEVVRSFRGLKAPWFGHKATALGIGGCGMLD
jgi:hypothetical protein